jgi:asparagine synthase (glutamine-hydrolysing)
MCGIAGTYSPDRPLAGAAVGTMLDVMAHRGPDDRGTEVLAGGALVLGHLRLSILDLSPLGHQPMASADRTAWIVYNGEVYNFREVRSELTGLGWRFRSDSDTEVILAAYRQWGLEAIGRFRGMFAFALWDGMRRQLHLCRDRFGVKPLYYSVRDGVLAFASESKALNCAGRTSRSVDPTSVAEFVQYGYISAPRSVFADVSTVRPGTVCTFDEHLQRQERVYWQARDLFDGEEATRLRAEVAALADEPLLDRVEASLQQAFEYRMVADVPVGLFLSGGIDSSLVATLLARRSGIHLNTFTIGYGASEFDETVYARQVAATLGATHVELEVSPQAALDIAMEIPEIADEPIGDSSLVPTLMVSRLARQHVKVALSADGADELFGGYARYAYCGDFARRQTGLVKALYRLSGEVLDRLPPRLIARAYAVARSGGPKFAAIDDKLRKFVRMSRARDAFEAYDAATSEWPERESLQLLKSPPPAAIGARAMFESVLGADVRDRFMHQDVMRYLPGDLLVKVDRASMFVSLEAREPFLDHEAARLAAALPISWKIRDGQNKYVLRRLLARYFPPQLFDRPKQGFSAPVGQWLRGPLREPFLEALSPARVRAAGLLDEHVVSAAVDSFLSSAGRHGSPAAAWILFQLQQWADRWLRAPEPQHASVRAVAL